MTAEKRALTEAIIEKVAPGLCHAGQSAFAAAKYVKLRRALCRCPLYLLRLLVK